MKSRRVARASEAVREVVATTILFGLRDPRIQGVTVLGAEVAKDLRTAKVFVSVMGDAKQQSLTMHGLESARGFIQSKIAERLDTRYTPVLKFVLDQGVKRSIEVARMLRETEKAGGESAGGLVEVNEGEEDVSEDSNSESAAEADQSAAALSPDAEDRSRRAADEVSMRED